MDNDKLKQTAQRTEEVRDIIDRMPHRTSFMVALFLLGFAILGVFFGFVIEYPETVSGPVTITARKAPVRLVANLSGKIHLKKKQGDQIRENELIAWMDNAANIYDVNAVEQFLKSSHPDSLTENPLYHKLPFVTSLGELNTPYFSLRNAIEKLALYRQTNPFGLKRSNVKAQIDSQEKMIKLVSQQVNLKNKSLQVAMKNCNKDSTLYRSSAIAELDLDRSSVNYLGILETTQALQKEVAGTQSQLTESRHQLGLLTVEQLQTEQQLQMELITAFNQLSNDISQWKLRYLFVAPFDGTLEYLNFWHENDFIQAGAESFSVLPLNNPLVGQVFLPTQGAGKVNPNQKVIIKLENYPYNEYGSVSGVVRSVSALTNQAEEVTRKNNVHTYLVTVDLPQGLTTNYGTQLDFRYEIKGIADIITKPRKLIERLFDNLKYIASKK